MHSLPDLRIGRCTKSHSAELPCLKPFVKDEVDDRLSLHSMPQVSLLDCRDKFLDIFQKTLHLEGHVEGTVWPVDVGLATYAVTVRSNFYAHAMLIIQCLN